MALTRKFLNALGIDEEKVDEIITAHTDTVTALKEQRDKYKADADKLPEVEKERDTLKAQLDENGENPFEGKYKALKKEFDDYKADVTEKETKEAKKTAFKAFLKKIGINEKRIDSVVKVAEANGTIDKLELNENGEINGEEELATETKNEWADFLVETSVQGANTATPPANNGGNSKSREEILKIKDTNERQQAWKDYYNERNN